MDNRAGSPSQANAAECNEGMPPGIRIGHSCAAEARDAVCAFHAAVEQPNTALVMFFCSTEYNLEVISEEIRRLFTGVQVVGCTTAGEIGPAGYRDHSITGVSFPAGNFHAVSGIFKGLRQFESAAGDAVATGLLEKLVGIAPEADATNSFGLLLIDGLSVREEPVTRALQNALGKLPLVGGSAGDGLNFGSTKVYFEGRFHSDSATLTVVTTRLPFKLFKTQHFVATDERMVVTDADAARRVVNEINGLPAAHEYARVLHLNVGDLDPLRFAASPVVVMIDGTTYVRSIQRANPDGSLTFFCAIENGLVLRVARGIDLLKNLEQTFTTIREEIGPPQLVLCCDCILRKLEVLGGSEKDRIVGAFQQNNAIGFNTYGEQFSGVHINQTLVGIAIGSGASVSKND